MPIKGLTDKCSTTLTFIVLLSGEFLPMQIIYSGKTKASLSLGLTFPAGFCLTHNPNPYVVKKQAELQLQNDQKFLIVWDIFKGQMTKRVKEELKSLDIELVPAPANMTHVFSLWILPLMEQPKIHEKSVH